MLGHAAWIQCPVDLSGGAVSFEYSFEADGAVRRATLRASALGVYEPYMNGQRATDDLFLPGWTNYHWRIQVQTMDVTAMLARRNTLRLLCANGWAVGHIGYDGSEKNYADRPAVIAALSIEYEDGRTEEIVTGGHWRTFSSPIVYSDIYGGETVDYTAPVRALGAAVPVQAPGRLIAQEGEPVRAQERIAAVRRLTSPKGEILIDFGQNIAGHVEIRVTGRRGDRIVLRHAEVLDRDGNLYTENLRAARATATYVLRGEGEECLRQTFSWQGFRYIALDEFPADALKTAHFTAVAVYSAMTRTGRFACGHPGVNQLYSNLVWGQRGNFLDVPTDCPQRDERLGWTGDAQVFCRTAALNYDVRRFFGKWLKDLASEQRGDGAVYGIAPVVMHESQTRISAAWGDAAVICPWVLYEVYGDAQILRDQFDSMRGWVDYMSYHTEGGEFLWLGGEHYGDWLAMDNGEGVLEGATSQDLIATAFYAHSTALLVKAGRVLGRDMSEYEALHGGIVRAFRERFTKGGLPVCLTQTACALMLRFDLCEDRARVADQLAELVIANGKRLNTGFVGTPHLLYALSENGHTALAYDLLLQEQFPSWLYSVRQGATTVWEHWDGINERGDMWSAEMNSFNHYAYGAVGEWLYRTVAGIREAAPGFGEILFCPVPDARLGWAEASLDTAHGVIRSAWRIAGDTVRYEVTVPEGTRAEIRLPGGTREALSAGSYVFAERLG